MITNGYLQSFILPLLLFIPLGIRIMSESISLEEMRQIVPELPVGLVLIALEIITAIFVSMGVGMSSISSSIISREGKDYYVLKAMPVSMRTIVAAKHRVAALFNCIPAVGYPTLLVVACTVLGILPVWSVAAVLGFGIPFMHLMVSFCSLGDVTKPNLNWENEADVCKNNTRGVILFLVFFLGSIGIGFLLVKFSPTDFILLVLSIAVLVVNLVGAVICYRSLMRASEELPERY